MLSSCPRSFYHKRKRIPARFPAQAHFFFGRGGPTRVRGSRLIRRRMISENGGPTRAADNCHPG